MDKPGNMLTFQKHGFQDMFVEGGQTLAALKVRKTSFQKDRVRNARCENRYNIDCV